MKKKIKEVFQNALKELGVECKVRFVQTLDQFVAAYTEDNEIIINELVLETQESVLSHDALIDTYYLTAIHEGTHVKQVIEGRVTFEEIKQDTINSKRRDNWYEVEARNNAMAHATTERRRLIMQMEIESEYHTNLLIDINKEYEEGLIDYDEFVVKYNDIFNEEYIVSTQEQLERINECDNNNSNKKEMFEMTTTKTINTYEELENMMNDLDPRDCTVAKEYCSGDCNGCDVKARNFVTFDEEMALIEEEQKKEYTVDVVEDKEEDKNINNTIINANSNVTVVENKGGINMNKPVSKVRKAVMPYTMKMDIFKQINNEPVYDIVDGYLKIKKEFIDLRPVVDIVSNEDNRRYEKKLESITNNLAISVVRAGESIASHKYVQTVNNQPMLFELICVAFGSGDDKEEETIEVKDISCNINKGIAIPISSFETVGNVPVGTQVVLDGERHLIYRVAMQSGSEDRQCKATFTCLGWESFVREVSGNALCLDKATKNPVKGKKYLGLGKTGGTVITDIQFDFIRTPDLETEIEFKAKCYNDKDGTFKNCDGIENPLIKKKVCSTDGHGWMDIGLAKILAKILNLNYIPGAFQIRYGQVKGILGVIDFKKLTKGKIKTDVIFTDSMWKEDFDVSKAEFLVANVAKPTTEYCSWNYQMFTCLNNQLNYVKHIKPHMEAIEEYFSKALDSVEDAIAFLRIFASTETKEDSNELEITTDSAIESLTACMQANPEHVFKTKVIKKGIESRIKIMAKKMLRGKVPMPQSTIAMFITDPFAFFNRLRDNGNISDIHRFNFKEGEFVINPNERQPELKAGEFYFGGYEGSVLGMRTPLTHWAQIRKFKCVSLDKERRELLKYLSDMMVFNVYDATALGMGGADFDGDFGFFTKLFVDSFKEADYVIYNDNPGADLDRVILTHEVFAKQVRKNLVANVLGRIVNANTCVLELLNDEKALRMFISLVSCEDFRYDFGNDSMNKKLRRVFAKKFANIETAREFLQRLNHALTTMSELEVDKPSNGVGALRFTEACVIPFVAKWFGDIKGKTANFYSFENEKLDTNDYGNVWRRTLRKEYENGTVKMLIDTMKFSKTNKNDSYVSRTIKLFTDTDSIMSNIYRFVNDRIIGIQLKKESCQDISEVLASSDLLNMTEVENIMGSVMKIETSYRNKMKTLVEAKNSGLLDEDDYSIEYQSIIDSCDTEMRLLSDNRVDLAYCAYKASLRSDSSQTFPIKVCLDGFIALLKSTAEIRYEEINIKATDIPENANHIVVSGGKFRLTEDIDSSKKFLGKINLMSGTYEIRRNGLNGKLSVVVPKPAKKYENNIPIGKDFAFQIKVSYNYSELSDENKNGDYVSELIKDKEITFVPTTINGNTQYSVMADGIWVGIILDVKDKNVLTKDIARSLINKKFSFDSIPTMIVKKDNNSTWYTNKENKVVARPAQILKFKEIYEKVEKEEKVEINNDEYFDYSYDEIYDESYMLSEEELATVDAMYNC